MAVPKKRHTSSRRDKRRSHHALKFKALISCSHCGKSIFQHQVCEHCGWYKDRQVIDVLAKLEKAKKRRKQKELDKEAEGKRSKSLSMEELSKKS